MKAIASALSVLLFLQQHAPAPVERRTPESPTFVVRTQLVTIPLNAVDAHNAPIGGLARDDFEVTEDGKPQRIAVFEKESATPLSIVLAIDTSESIYNDIKLEREAAKHFVQTLLRPQDEIDLMQFADTTRELVPFTNQAKRIDSGLGELKPGDETGLYNTISLASQELGKRRGSPEQRRVLVIVTDGENTVKKGYQYPDAVEQALRAGVMVYALIMVPVRADAGRNVGGEHALMEMTQDTGGKYYYVNDPRDLKEAMGHVSDDLRTQYLLGYYAPQRRANDRTLHAISVRLKDAESHPGVSLRYRSGYYADAR